MEADWEVEIGSGAAVIDAHWAGLVDLRQTPELAQELTEVARLPALGTALERLNGGQSPVWTAKCDVWPQLGKADFDADEMEGDPESDIHACACYIDLLAGTGHPWSDAPGAVAVCRTVCSGLRATVLRRCRVDLVVRAAVFAQGKESLGITAYLTACGSTVEQAKLVLSGALERFADTLLGDSTVE